MTLPLADIPLDRAALLILHYQADVFSLLFGDRRPPLLDRCNALIGQWRTTGRPVVFANFSLGPNYEAVSPGNRLVTGLTATGLFRGDAPAPGLDVGAGDRRYACPRVSVFRDTSLDEDLRAQGLDTLVMAGVTSSGVVLSSVAYASDADYDIRLVRDCCHDPDEQAHEALFRTGFATRATII